MAIIFLLSVGAASAADNADDDMGINEVPDTPISQAADLQNDILKADEESFEQLENYINDTQEKGTLVLQNNFEYVSGDGIVIDKEITIDGADRIIDGKKSTGIFSVEADNVVLKNIIFLNAVDTAVWVSASNCTIENCTFINNSGVNGGAICWDGENGNLTRSTFIDNNASGSGYGGGAVYWKGNDGTVSGSSFKGNYANGMYGGGAIFWVGENGVLSNSVFDNNRARNHGGAVYWTSRKIFMEFDIDFNSNGSVIGCNFTNNSAKGYGGAVYWDGINGNLLQSTFVSNNASGYYGGGAVYWNGENGTVSESFFKSNYAGGGQGYTFGGGAIFWNGDNGVLSGSIFNNNTADNYGGAIYWASPFESGYFIADEIYNSNGTVVDCNFTSNSAENGGAILWQGENGKVIRSNFNNNTADISGGAVYWRFTNNEDASDFAMNIIGANGTVSECNFTKNNATDGGAIYWETYNGTVSDSLFMNNTAYTSGGAVVFLGNNTTLHNSTFILNSVKDYFGYGGAVYWYSETQNLTVSLSRFINNSAVWCGGAIYSEGEILSISDSNFTGNAAGYGGAIDMSTSDVSIRGSNFTRNIASETAGAIYLIGENIILDWDYFDGNIAQSGSAISFEEAYSVNISNTKFARNRANSSDISISISGNETYNPLNVTITAALSGNNNIANAIWLGDDVDLTEISFKNITCEFSEDGKGRSFKQFNVEGFENPTDGFEDTSKIWKSEMANAQLIDILVISESEGVVMNITGGIDSVSKNSQQLVTDVNGELSVNLSNLKAGRYTVIAEHRDDEYYSAISDETSLAVYELNVTKTSESDEYDVGDLVSFEITITNNGDQDIESIFITDNIPAGLEFDDEHFSDLNENWTYLNDGAFSYNNELKSHESIVLSLDFTATKAGTFNNSVEVGSDVCDPFTVYSNDFTVYAPNFTVSKKAVTPYVFIGEEAVFIINVTNTGDRPLSKEHGDYIRVDELPDLVLEYLRYENVSGTWQLNNEPLGFILTSELGINESAAIYVYFQPEMAGILLNNVSLYGREDKASDKVIVISKMYKQVSATEIVVNQTVLYTIFIENGHDKMEDVIITDALNESFVLNESSIQEPYTYENGLLTFDIGEIYEYDENYITFRVKITEKGNYTNVANVSFSIDGVSVQVPIESKTVRVLEPAMNVTKMVDKNETDVEDSVKYTVVINNTGECPLRGIFVSDKFGEDMILDDDSISENWSYDSEAGGFAYDGEIAVGENASLEFKVKFTKKGNYTNVVNVTAEGMGIVTAESEVTRVYEPAINMTKTAVNSTVYLGNQAVFIINVTNTGERLLTADDWVIVEDWCDERLVYDHFESVSGDWSYEFQESNAFILKSDLDVGESASFMVYFNTTELGEFNNTAVSWLAQDNAYDTVNVVLSPVEIKVANVTGSPGDAISIQVNVTAASGVPFNDMVNITLPDNSTALNIVNGSGYINWTVPDGYDGVYHVNVSFEGNEYLMPSNGTGYVTVEMVSTQISVENVTCHPGENVTVHINVTADDKIPFNASINVTLPDGTYQSVKIVDGSGEVTFTAGDEGEYAVEAVFWGNGRYSSSEASGTVIVELISSHISVENVTTYPGVNVTVQINVTTDDNKAFSGNISVEFPDGSIQTVEITNGNGNVKWFVLENYAPDTYNVTASYEGNGPYSASNATGSITVLPKASTAITVANVTVYPDSDVTLSIEVSCDDGEPFTGNVTVRFADDTTQSVEIINGSGNATWHAPSDIGNYSVNVEFAGDISHFASNATGNVEVEAVPVSINLDGNNTGKAGHNVTIEINVTADNGEEFNGNVSVKFADGSTQTVEVINGSSEAVWSIPEDYDGEYEFTVEYAGDDTYMPTNATGTVTVIPKASTAITVADVSAYPESDVVVSIDVSSDDGEPFNGNVTVRFADDTTQSVEIINGSGNATWHAPSDIGNYSVNVEFAGDIDHFASNATGNVEVEAVPVDINLDGNNTGKAGHDVTVEINVTADNNKAFNGNVTVTFADGSTQTVEVINGSSEAVWSIPEDYDGEYEFTVEYAGDDTYKPTNATGTVTVIPKASTAITVADVSAYPESDVIVSIDVSSDDGEPFNGNVTVRFADDTTQSVEIINGSGNATWHAPSDIGNYSVSVEFAGDIDHFASNATGSIEVTSVPVSINVAGDVQGKAGHNVTIPLNVTSKDSRSVNGNVTVTLPDGTTQTAEIVNGSGNVTWSIPDEYKGDYDYTVEYPGDETFLPANATGTLNVIPKISIQIIVGNATAYQDSNVVIPINVTSDDEDVPFNGDVKVYMPDGSIQIVEIGDGDSSVLQLSLNDILAAARSTIGTGEGKWHVPSDYPQGNYPVLVVFEGNDDFLAANGTGNVEITRIPTEISLENDLEGKAGHDVTIPIKVTSDDNKPFNGNVTVSLPDGTTETAEITNGEGSVVWSIPSDYNGTYEYGIEFSGNETHMLSNATGTINVIPKVPTSISVGNITAHPGDKVTIPIKVTPQDGSVFNGKVTVELPDGTQKEVEIVDGEGSVDWTVPDDYEGYYFVKVILNETDDYYSSEGTGMITVTVDEPADDNVTSDNDTSASHSAVLEDTPASHETGNPILALLVVLALLGVNTKRRK